MISNLYERRLLYQIDDVPKNVTLVVAEKDLRSNDSYKKIGSFASWCKEIGIHRVTVYISVMDLGEDVNKRLRAQIVSKITNSLHAESLDATIYLPDEIRTTDNADAPTMDISIGYGGKKELVDAIKLIAQKVKDGHLRADDISEETINSHLIFKEEPELVIRTGENRLTDFLIWQAVYSELYFTEVNWANFRKMDLLRAVRDYQRRQTRRGL